VPTWLTQVLHARIRSMKMTTGRVVSGRIVIEDNLEEGTSVTILAREGNETFELNAQDATELLAAIREGEHGDGVDGDEFLEGLAHQ
jgi:hypothetical protein